MNETNWNRLGDYLKQTQLLGSIQNTLYWDQNTMMPKKGASWRAEQLSYIAKKLHARNTSEEFSILIDSAKEELNSCKDGDPKFFEKKRNIQLLSKDMDRQRKLDPKLVELLAKAKSDGYQNWQQAKLDSQYETFLPFFKDLIKLRIEEAKQISENLSTWETLAQPYEPDISKKWVFKIFNPLKEVIPELLEKSNKYLVKDWDLDKESQHLLCIKLLNEFGRDTDLVASAESPHPFSITLGPSDYRITTRFVKGEPFSSFLATAHEWGHSIYEQNLPARTHQWFAWPLGQATSMSVHESQSLFWENRIVKSRSFNKRFFEYFAERNVPFNNYLELWRSINAFKAGLNRVEADELTYGLHIVIRTELEIELIEGAMDPKDLPFEWNKRYQDLLGIKPSNDREGCLQDVHWSEGAFGYFPSYLVGHVISAQLTNKMEKDLGTLDNLIEKKDYKIIIKWLKENVHQYGRSLNAMELVRKVTGDEINPDSFINYLKQKIDELM